VYKPPLFPAIPLTLRAGWPAGQEGQLRPGGGCFLFPGPLVSHILRRPTALSSVHYQQLLFFFCWVPRVIMVFFFFFGLVFGSVFFFVLLTFYKLLLDSGLPFSTFRVERDTRFSCVFLRKRPLFSPRLCALGPGS